MKKPLVLCIIDGFAFRESAEGNAIKAAKKPNLDRIFGTYPITTLGASGLSVGLPDGQMGNSEVGHTNMGAGRIVYQELTRISKSIKDGDFFENETLKNAILKAKEQNKTVHIMGLMSSGGVHSHIEHCFALIDMCKKYGVDNVVVHPFMDGRDVSPTSGVEFLTELQNKLNYAGIGKIGAVCGRFYAMDRDNRWDRVEKAYNAIVNGEGEYCHDPVKHLKECYQNNVTDEFTVPFIANKDCTIKDGDSVIFFNFRPDRAREITRALVDTEFTGFERKTDNLHLNYVCFTQYDASMPNVDVAFKPQSLKNTFGEYISDKGFTQLRIAETEKYAHVTFFFNGGVEAPYKNEDRALIPSPKVATYDLQPEMSAYLITDELLKRIDSDKYDVIILNFANCDMVGHTGVFEAAVKAVETVDRCIGKLYDKMIEKDGVLLITADHGNADQMVADDGTPFTQHTTNRVPFCVVNYPCDLRGDGVLADIAPTMLEIMGVARPEEMDGKSIIINF
ncbi:MAG: 2,3-bisphosphoglycerate-independent phosphoglycerate mutase [Oscillospiraceae bacterium]|nr:2,3-bisphosphoglycerate-independent phosphoglycerate mutase [Oscillospiraceae bacterium]